ncbi:MAG: T9SS type A sorting domain-containing protein [Cytophagaceae bacterium]
MNNKLSHYFLGLLIFFSCCFNLFGQDVRPLQYDVSRVDEKRARSRVNFVPDTLQLPFFDDFSNYSGNPDTNRWFPGGGTFINNSFPINPPSLNAATFDGIRENGRPYSISTSTAPNAGGATGRADNLTSLPIDLSGIDPSDESVYLSFYWQSGGNGEHSDYTDSLRLTFKTPDGTWVRQWSKVATSQVIAKNDTFIRESVRVSSQFFYKHFQFRFENYGRLSGMYDIWNVDYVYLNKDRTANDEVPDITVSSYPSTFLKTYQSIPANHFYISETKGGHKDAVNPGVNIYRIGPQKTTNTDIYIHETLSNDQLAKLNIGGSYFQNQTQKSPWNFSNMNIPKTSEPQIIRQCVNIISSEGVVNGVDYRVNDSVCNKTYMIDYYAYDDGSAEWGIGSNFNGAILAQKYNTYLKDTLTDVAVYFPRMIYDFTNQPLTLIIYSEINTNNGTSTILHQQGVTLQYSELNQFVKYKLSKPVIVDTVFYIGFRQQLTRLYYLGFGYDTNYDNRDNIFFHNNSSWEKTDTDIPGSIMIRPIFDKGFVLSTPKEELTENKQFLFPNPTNGELNIRGTVERASLYDISGRVLQEWQLDKFEDSHQIQLHEFPAGIYFLQLVNKSNVNIQKIIISK